MVVLWWLSRGGGPVVVVPWWWPGGGGPWRWSPVVVSWWWFRDGGLVVVVSWWWSRGGGPMVVAGWRWSVAVVRGGGPRWWSRGGGSVTVVLWWLSRGGGPVVVVPWWWPGGGGPWRWSPVVVSWWWLLGPASCHSRRTWRIARQGAYVQGKVGAQHIRDKPSPPRSQAPCWCPVQENLHLPACPSSSPCCPRLSRGTPGTCRWSTQPPRLEP